MTLSTLLVFWVRLFCLFKGADKAFDEGRQSLAEVLDLLSGTFESLFQEDAVVSADSLVDGSLFILRI